MTSITLQGQSLAKALLAESGNYSTNVSVRKCQDIVEQLFGFALTGLSVHEIFENVLMVHLGDVDGTAFVRYLFSTDFLSSSLEAASAKARADASDTRRLGPPRQPPPIDPGDGWPHEPGMEARVAALEAGMKDVRVVLARMEPLLIRIDERTNHLATKAELATKATKATVWAMGFTVAGLFVAALAAGAVYMPYLATLLRRAAA